MKNSGVSRIYQQGQKKNLGRQNRARSAQFFSSAPTPYYFSGAEQTRGGLITLLYLEKEGGTSNNRSLSKPQLTVLLCVNAMHFLIGYSGVSRNHFSRDRKNIRWGRITPEGRKFFFCPHKKKSAPLPPPAEQARGGGKKRKREKHLIIENRGREPN